jgi:hypothetical protein
MEQVLCRSAMCGWLINSLAFRRDFTAARIKALL